MNALLARARERWNGLSPQERQWVLGGGVLLALLILYLLLWLPLQKDLNRLRASVPESQAQLQRMIAQSATIQPLRGQRATPPSPGTLVSLIDQSASQRGLRALLTRLEADGTNGVQIQAEAAAFNSLIAWLAELQESHALVIDSATFDAHTAAGTVNARIRLHIGSP